MVAARGQLSKDMEKEVAAFVKANPHDIEFGSLSTEAQKCAKLYDRSAEDFSLKLNKFSVDVDLDKQKSPSTRKTERRNFKRVMDRNKDRLLKEQARASAADARFLHPAAAAAFPHQHYHLMTPHLHPHQHGPHHCSAPMFQPITQGPYYGITRKPPQSSGEKKPGANVTVGALVDSGNDRNAPMVRYIFCSLLLSFVAGCFDIQTSQLLSISLLSSGSWWYHCAIFFCG